MLFWTKEGYLKFAEAVKEKPYSYYAFQILYWCGERYYFGKQIAGYLSFVKMIEGEDGLKKIYSRVEKSTAGRIAIKDRINNL